MTPHLLLLLPESPTYPAHAAALRDAGFQVSVARTRADALAAAGSLGGVLISESGLLDASPGVPAGLLLLHPLPLREEPCLETATAQLAAVAEPARLVGAVRGLLRRQAREERLRGAARALRVGLYEFDFVTGRGEYSPEAKAIFGLDPESELPLDQDLLPTPILAEDREPLRRAVAEALTGAGALSAEYRIRRPDGEVRWLRVRARVFFEGEGASQRPVWAAGMLLDVTAEREATAALTESEQLLRQALERAPVPVVVHALDDGEILMLSDAVPAMLGWSREELRHGRDWFMRVHGLDAGQAEQALRQALADFGGAPREPREFDVRTRDGRARRWLFQGSARMHLANGRPFAVSIATDITDHLAAERELERSNALLDAIFAGAPVGMGFWDRDMRFRRVNAQLAEMNGLPVEAHIGKTPMELLPELEDLEELTRTWREILRSGQPAEMEISGETPAAPGRRRYWKERFFPVRVADEIVGLSGVVDEVTEQREAEQQLRESERRFRQFAENIEDVLWMSDPAARTLLYVSPAFERVWGMPCEAPHHDFGVWLASIHPEDRARVEARFFATVLTTEGYDEQYRIVRPDGSVRWIRDRGLPVRDEQGRTLCAAGIAEDITERHAAEERLRAEERRYHEIFEAAGTAMWESDYSAVADELDALAARGVRDLRAHLAAHPGELGRLLSRRRILDVNPAALRMHGARTREELLGALPQLRGPGAEEQMVRTLEAIARGETRLEFDMQVRTLDGRTLDTLATVALSPAGERPLRMLLSLHDVTTLKRAEAVLLEANQRKDEFLAMLAHELRNPLAPIRNAAEALRLTHTEEPVVKWARDVIERQVSHLAHMVDDLLDISRIVQGKATLHREPVDLRAVARSALETSRPLIDGRGHALVVDLPSAPVVANVDFVRMAQVIANLLNNAAKYTPPDGRITLALAREGQESVLRVTDTGEGMPPELLTQVFDLFTQAHRTLDRAQGGLGIGLTVVKRLVELHGGSVVASSDGPGRGSTFTLRLPTCEEEPLQGAATAPAARHADDHRGLRVLVVDDNRDAVDSLAELLRLSGHDVRTAEDGPGAVVVASAFHPDVGLLDLGLPGMDGFELARRLRELPGTAGAMLVAVTGYGQDEDVRQALEVGFDHHMVKPIDLQALRALLARRQRAGRVPGTSG